MNRNVFLLALCQALLTTGNVLLVSVTALIGQSLSPTAALTTLPVATQFVGLMLATIPASLIMQRIGRKRGFYLGNGIGIAGASLCLAALGQERFYLFAAGTLLLGVGIGFGTLYRFAAVEACAPEQKSRAISLVMAGGVVAAVLGPALSVNSQAWFPQAPFMGAFGGLLGLYILALLLLARVRLPRAAPQPLAGASRPLGQIMAQPGFIVAVVAAMVSYTTMNLLMTATPLAMSRCGYPFSAAAHVIEWHVLGMFVPSFFTGSLISRFGVQRVIACGAMLFIASIAVNLQGVQEYHFWLGLLLLGVGWNFMFIGATQLLTEVYFPAEKAKVQAANEFLVFSMVTLSAMGAGWLEAALGWHNMNWMMLPLLIWTLLVILFLGRRRERLAAG